MANRRSWTPQRAHAARLSCGSVLTYDAPSFVPALGESVPCPRHGYCTVTAHERVERHLPGPSSKPPRKSVGELTKFLDRQPVTAVGLLRRNGFTLRIVTAAEKQGLVDVDLISGRVALRIDDSMPRRPTTAPLVAEQVSQNAGGTDLTTQADAEDGACGCAPPHVRDRQEVGPSRRGAHTLLSPSL